MAAYEELKTITSAYGQKHLLRFWDELNPDQQGQLAAQIKSIDIPRITHHFKVSLGLAVV